eukprot:Hpha_TRINITY_DN16642_c2_g1::TRINITY_DN16642_c2_g1_i1::g.180053::m.180053
MLSIQCLSISLSVALVFITGGIIGGLSISTGNEATDRTKTACGRGLAATSEVCREGFAQLDRAANDGVTQSLTSARKNAEYLTQLVMGQALTTITARVESFFDNARLISEIVHGAFMGMSVEEWGDREMWRKLMRPEILSKYYQGYKRGMTILTVNYDSSEVDGVEQKERATFSLSNVVQPTEDYAAHNVVTRMKFYCDGLSKGACETENCVWCSKGAQGYCGNPMRRINGESRPCRTSEGFSPPPGYTLKWYQLTDVPYAMGVSKRNGELYVGSCGLDDPKCGCAALRDYRLKKGNDLNEADMRGSYRRQNGSYPEPGTVSKSELLEAGICQVPQAMSQLTIQTTVFDDAKYGHNVVHWTPMYGGPTTPLLTLQCFMSAAVGDKSIKLNAGVDLERVSRFMNSSDLPAGSRVYLVQSDAWKAGGRCQDDFHHMLRKIGMTCDIASRVLSMIVPGEDACDVDLAVLSPRIARFNTLREHCPASCGVCRGNTFPREVYEGYLVGASHEPSYRKLPPSESNFINISGALDLVAIKAVDSTDPVVSAHAKYVTTNLTGFETLPQDTNWTDLAGQLWWVKRETIVIGELAETQLRLTLVLLVQRDKAMELIDEGMEKTKREITGRQAAAREDFAVRERETVEQIKRDDDETERKKEQGLIIMIVVAVVSVTILLVASVVLVRLFIAPLLVLESEMAQVAHMRLDIVDRGRKQSRLAEVAGMQRSFFQMVEMLIQYRSYMPHSVLCDDQEEEEQEGESPRARKSGRSIGTKSRRSIRTENSGSSDHSASSVASAVAIRKLKAYARRARASLAAGNMLGYLSSTGDLAGQSNAELIALDVERWCVSVIEVRGLVDLISGDRRYATFNAKHSCTGHASAAVGVLSSRGEGWSGCVVTGQVVCGDFG